MKMKVLKKLMCCASFSFVCSNALLGANPLQVLKNSRGVKMWEQQVVRSISPSMANALQKVTAVSPLSVYRFHSSFHRNGVKNQDSQGVETRLLAKPGGQQNEDTAELLTLLRTLTEVLTLQTELLTQPRSNTQSAPTSKTALQPAKPPLKLSKINPITATISGSETPQSYEETGALNTVESQETLVNERIQTRPQGRIARREENRNESNSDIVVKLREEFMDEIMQCVQVPNKITREDVTAILDVYGSLPHRTIEGITRVLNGQIDSFKSGTHNNVKRYLEANGSTLPAFRDIYSRLCEAFREDAMQVLLKVSVKITDEIREKITAFKRSGGKNMTQLDGIDTIVECADPLYPIHAYEVDMLLNVYTALPNRPKEGITNVLNGQVDTIKSGIYNNVKNFVESKQLSLDVYRNAYIRLSRSANGRGTEILYSILENR